MGFSNVFHEARKEYTQMSVERNIVANYIGRGWVAIASFLFIPLYIQYLGVEAYGAIAFFASLMSALSFLDFGMGQTLVRETARGTGSGCDKKSLTGLLGTLEYIYWTVGVLAAIFIWKFSNWLAVEWLSAEGIGKSDLVFVIQIMGIVATTRWAASPYRSVLTGLQIQVWLNFFEVGFATIRGLGALAILAWVSDTVQAFFLFQGLIAIVELVWLRLKVWSAISARRFMFPEFNIGQLQRVRKFTGGVAAISILGSVVSQIDKLLLPGLVSLKVFGYYMLAQALGRAIIQLSFPIATAYRPLFARLVECGRLEELSLQYHKASQLMALSIIPAAMVIAVFSKQILWIWTGNSEIAAEASMIVSLITLGTMLNGLVNIPYSIQLAHGYLKLSLLVNFFSAVILVPVFYFGVTTYGVIAAGWIWFLLNLSYVLINVSMMHRKHLLNQARAWYFQDTLPVLVGACAVLTGVDYFMPATQSKWIITIILIISLLAALLVACLMASYVRKLIWEKVFKIVGMKFI